MRAVVMRSFGSENVLELSDVEEPRVGPGEVLVRVAAVEVSRSRDVATRTGNHPFSQHVTLPHVLGGDFAGVVEAVGSEVPRKLLEQRVVGSCTIGCGQCSSCISGQTERCPQLEMLGIHRWGSYAELVSIPAANVRAVPDEVSMEEAAALAATGPIAHKQLEVAGVYEGTAVVVPGATGALATVLQALATARGARVISLSRRPHEIPQQLVVAARLDANDPGLARGILDAAGDQGVEAAVDNIADPDVFLRYFPALAIGGRVVISGAIGADGSAPMLKVPAGVLYFKSLLLQGVRTATRADAEAFWQLVDEGFRLPPGLIQTFPLEHAPETHARIAAAATVGHTILTIN